jgi:hypothetical protein
VGRLESPLDAAGPIAADYRSTHGSMRAGSDRTRAMEEVVAQARLAQLALATAWHAEPSAE